MTPDQRTRATYICETWRELTDSTGLIVREVSDLCAMLIAYGVFPSGVEWRCERAYPWVTLTNSLKPCLYDLLRSANQAAMKAACTTDSKRSRKKK